MEILEKVVLLSEMFENVWIVVVVVDLEVVIVMLFVEEFVVMEVEVI